MYSCKCVLYKTVKSFNFFTCFDYCSCYEVAVDPIHSLLIVDHIKLHLSICDPSISLLFKNATRMKHVEISWIFQKYLNSLYNTRLSYFHKLLPQLLQLVIILRGNNSMVSQCEYCYQKLRSIFLQNSRYFHVFHSCSIFE